MKLLWTVSSILAVTLVQSGPADQVATYVDHDKVAACAKGGSLFKVPEYEVICYNRSTDGNAEVHPNWGHIFYILDGEATFVTDGTFVAGEKPTIKDGIERTIKKGDVIVIPAGTNHWFKHIVAPVAYYSVNVTKP